MSLRRLLALPLFLFVPLLPAACASPTEEDAAVDIAEPLTQVGDDERAAAQREAIDPAAFEHLTPTATNIMKASQYWMRKQSSDSRYPRPRMCASNVSKVLFLSGVTAYDQQGVRALISDVNGKGGRVIRMPRDPSAFAAALQSIDGGRLPAGTLVAGMNVSTSAPGDQHVGVVGHTDADGTVWVYHNNWYRPDNEHGVRKPYMVSEDNLRRGFLRQWMATPWIRISRDGAGKIKKVESLLPAVDDMDPFNSQFQVTLAILPEVARELDH